MYFELLITNLRLFLSFINDLNEIMAKNRQKRRFPALLQAASSWVKMKG